MSRSPAKAARKADKSFSSVAQREKSEKTTGGDSRRTWFVAVVLCALTLAVFLQAAHFGFLNLDDDKYVSENPIIQKGLTLEGIKYAFTAYDFFYWHPVTWLSHMLDCQLYGLDAGWHHVTNVLIHTANVVLVFFVLMQATGAFWRSYMVAALFAIHPLRVESVAWVAERKDLLSCLFWLLAIWMYLGYVQGREGRKKYLLALFMFALGIMSKPTVITLPFALLLLDYWPLGRFSLASAGRLVKEKIPFFCLSAFSAAITYIGQKQFGAVHDVNRFAPGMKVQNVVHSYGIYVRDLIWPGSMGVFYPYPRSLSAVVVLACLTLLVGITAVVLWLARKAPYLPVGWFWFLGVLVPMIGIVQVGLQARADRFTYIPAIGFFIMMVWGASALANRYGLSKNAGFCVAALVLVVFAARSWMQLQYWRSAETLYTHTIAITGWNPLLKNSLGVTYMHQGRAREAEVLFRSSLRDDPTDADCQNNLGITLIQEQRWAEAVDVTSQALRAKPNNASALFTRAFALNELHQTSQALRGFQQALQYGLPPDLAAVATQYVQSAAMRSVPSNQR